ncbi:MAG: hypothetical protein N3D73_00090 [Candidatus Diapherotrites archaeon]|nr:hypothetical protein [Candidatus Diapherotrites archaeon]
MPGSCYKEPKKAPPKKEEKKNVKKVVEEEPEEDIEGFDDEDWEDLEENNED